MGSLCTKPNEAKSFVRLQKEKGARARTRAEVTVGYAQRPDGSYVFDWSSDKLGVRSAILKALFAEMRSLSFVKMGIGECLQLAPPSGIQGPAATQRFFAERFKPENVKTFTEKMTGIKITGTPEVIDAFKVYLNQWDTTRASIPQTPDEARLALLWSQAYGAAAAGLPGPSTSLDR